jgi:hypothetical protein
MSVSDVVSELEAAGAAFRLDGEKVRVSYPNDQRREELAEQIDLLRAQRSEVAAYLKVRSAIPSMPEGVRLVRWEPKLAPVILTRFAVVTDVTKFISLTLLELRAALAGEPWQSGHWTLHELMDRLEQCGVFVQIGETEPMKPRR